MAFGFFRSQAEVDLEGGALLGKREAHRAPKVLLVLGVLAVGAFCGLATPKNSVLSSAKNVISLAERTMRDQMTDPQCDDFPKMKILEVTHSNLDNKGPDEGEEGLQYHISTSKGEEFYMTLHAVKDFDFQGDKIGMEGGNKELGHYGRLNVGSLEDAWLKVTFRDYKTGKPAKVKDFTLTFMDLDTGYRKSGVEAMTIEGDWTMAVVAKDTTVLVHHTEEEERKITFQGTNQSAHMDDADTPGVLDLNQYNKAITIRFQNANKFLLGLHVRTKISYPRIFEFIGYASVLCAHSPNKGEALPIGQVYINEDQLSEVKVDEEIEWWWVVAAVLLGCCLVAMCIPFCLPAGKSEVKYRELVPMIPARSKQGPGIYAATLRASGAKLGLQLDAPQGLGVPPMVKKVLDGAVDTFNKEHKDGRWNAIEPHDIIVKVGEVSDPNQIMAELQKGLPAEANLQLDRPHEIVKTLNGNLGVKLDSLEDSYGAVIVAIESHGSIAKYNAENPGMKMNKGDRIISVNGQTFDPKKGWTVRSKSASSKDAKASFGSRQNSRFLEEVEELKDKDVEVVMLKFTTFDK